MHIKRLTKIAEWLEAGGKEERLTFDMEHGLRFEDVTDHTKMSACQTSCCIAGAATFFFNNPSSLFKELKKENNQLIRDAKKLAKEFNDQDWKSYFKVDDEVMWDTVSDEAMELLDLDRRQATRLFEPNRYFGYSLEYYNDPAWAARTIRHLIETGEVDWNITKR